jgi:hypothetical protein
MHQTSSPYHIGADRNLHFSVETFFCQRCCDTLFWPIGSCIMLSPIRACPGFGVRPTLPEVALPRLLKIDTVIRNTRDLLIRFSFDTSAGSALIG